MKKTFVLLLGFATTLFSCKKDDQNKDAQLTEAEKIVTQAYKEMAGTWLLVDEYCGNCGVPCKTCIPSNKPHLANHISVYLTIKKDGTYEYKRNDEVSKGTFTFQFTNRCGAQQLENALLFVTGNENNLPPSLAALTLAQTINLKNDTLTIASPKCMIDQDGYASYKKVSDSDNAPIKL